MQLLAPAPASRHQVGHLQHAEMLGHRLPRHIQMRAQFAQTLGIVRIQEIEQLAPGGIGERLEENVRVVHFQVECYASNYLHVKWPAGPGPGPL